MKTTTATKKKDLNVNWHHIDAKGKVLGRMSTDIATLLQGKNKVEYVPYLNCGDKVVLTNSKNVVLTGNKESQKVYYRHSGYAGNLKKHRAEQLRENNPNRIIYESVKGMLPKNKLRKQWMANLYIYEDENHPHEAQIGK